MAQAINDPVRMVNHDVDTWGIALQRVQALFHQDQLVLEPPENGSSQALVLVLKVRPFVRISLLLFCEFLI